MPFRSAGTMRRRKRHALVWLTVAAKPGAGGPATAGRYFPVTGPDDKSRIAACNGFCPASQIALVYGSDIDSAATANGRPYSELPNAYRYRDELVAGCTCNGKDQVGLAHVSIDNDPTLRKGDIVAGAKGLEVVTRSANHRGGSNFSPLPQSAQARFRHLPVVASGR